MIVKSHIRGGFRAAAEYLQEIGENELTRLVSISDPDASTLDEAFHNMWTVAGTTRVKKPLHHVSINPHQDERLTDEQVEAICAALEEKYGYAPSEHQRVVVEHVKDGRQHFHVMWNRVSLKTGRVVWPGHHWKKSRQVARAMEMQLGLKRPQPRRTRRRSASQRRRTAGRVPARTQVAPIKATFRAAGERCTVRTTKSRTLGRAKRRIVESQYATYKRDGPSAHGYAAPRRPDQSRYRPLYLPPLPQLPLSKRRRTRVVAPEPPAPPLYAIRQHRKTWQERLIEWAWANRRSNILARFGIYVGFGL